MNDTTKTYLVRFFDEKNLPFAQWSFTADDGLEHIISNEVVIETILEATPDHELTKIAAIIRRLDFADADVNGFLKHLAGALINRDAS